MHPHETDKICEGQSFLMAKQLHSFVILTSRNNSMQKPQHSDKTEVEQVPGIQ